MDEFTQEAKGKYDELDKLEKTLKDQLLEAKSEKQALKVFLVAKGVIQKQPRKSKSTSIK